MTGHDEGDDHLTVEHTLRSFPRIDQFVVQWDCPLFSRKPDLDPAKLKQHNEGGRPGNDHTEAIMTAFRAFEQEGGATVRQVSNVSLVNPRSVQRRVKELVGTRLVKAPLVKHGYQLSLAESNKMRTFIEEEDSNEEND